MAQANLLLRFLLELAALAGIGLWAWTLGDGWHRGVLAFFAVSVAVALWIVFNVPGDPSRSGAAPVPVPGWVRLPLELAILLGGAWAFHFAGQTTVAMVVTALIVLHYAGSVPRIRWLLRQ